MKNMKGFTLIEAIIAMTLLTISLLGVVAMQVYFGSQTTDKAVLNCLLDTASSALVQYRTNAGNMSSPVLCDEGRISVTVTNPGAYPASSACQDITITTSARGKTFNLSSKVCNFP